MILASPRLQQQIQQIKRNVASGGMLLITSRMVNIWPNLESPIRLLVPLGQSAVYFFMPQRSANCAQQSEYARNRTTILAIAKLETEL
jgi:hypothetical protein